MNAPSHDLPPFHFSPVRILLSPRTPPWARREGDLVVREASVSEPRFLVCVRVGVAVLMVGRGVRVAVLVPVGEAVDEPDAVPVKELEAVPVIELDAVPVAELDAVPVTELDAVPVKELDAVPVTELDAVLVCDEVDVPVEVGVPDPGAQLPSSMTKKEPSAQPVFWQRSPEGLARKSQALQRSTWQTLLQVPSAAI